MIFLLMNGLLDPLRSRGRSSTRGSLRDFLISCPPRVKTSEAGAVHHIKSGTVFLVFPISCLLKDQGDLRLIGKKYVQT